MNRKLVSVILAIIMIANLSIFSIIPIFAHDAMLEVYYDTCIESTDSDSVNEMWYVLVDEYGCTHLSDDEDSIRYYFEDNPYSGDSWANISDAEEIQTAYANSMKKWNNVYFYSYNSDGTITKHKIINVVEGNEEDHNLSIFPGTRDSGNMAETQAMWGIGIEYGTVEHSHYYDWEMRININCFSTEGGYSLDIVNSARERTGAHELGHVLGLCDLDHNNLCNADAEEQHHLELLMGYGEEITDRAQYITYKDIAGVAITRGFHTDNDHKWMNQGLRSDGKYKLVCSICNGVKEVDSLNEYSWVPFNSCSGNHTLSSGNMMAVASYGTKDYYKCKYCRYVAPFSSIVEQNYSKSNYSHSYHKCVNNVAGLEYSFYEGHTLVNNYCTECNEYIHSFPDGYEQYSSSQHRAYCECGKWIYGSHSYYYATYSSLQHKVICDICNYTYYQPHIYASNATIKMCLRCGQLAGSGGVLLDSVGEVIYLTDSGSYLRPDGIIMLSDEDVSLYLAGELDIDALIRQATSSVK